MDWLARIRGRKPLVECVTNFVTVNDVANTILSAGASPVMAVECEELEDIISVASAVVINIGTATRAQLPLFDEAMRIAECLGKPVVFDPVGAGSSAFRTELSKHLLGNYRCAVIRGNASEVAALVNGKGGTVGVDASLDDTVTDTTLARHLDTVRELARKYNCTVAMSGAIDVICDAEMAFACRNGVERLSHLTGTGCSLTGLTAAFVAVASESERAMAAAAATAMMGCAGEIALEASQGNGTFRTALLDALSNMDDVLLEKMMKLEKI